MLGAKSYFSLLSSTVKHLCTVYPRRKYRNSPGNRHLKIARPKLLFCQAPYKLESTRLPFLYVMHVPVTKCNVNCKVLRHGKSYHIVPKVVWSGEDSSVPENPVSVQELIPDIFYDMTIVKRQEPCWIERVPGKDQ